MWGRIKMIVKYELFVFQEKVVLSMRAEKRWELSY